MDNIHVRLENCYGIKALDVMLDFSTERAYAIYAPNGMMKSSFAQTFQDAAKGNASKDRIFPERRTERSIRDEHGQELKPDSIFVVRPYDEEFGPTEKTSNLLVNATLRKEYERLQVGIDRAKDALLKALKSQSDPSGTLSEKFRPHSPVRTSSSKLRWSASEKNCPIKRMCHSPMSNTTKFSMMRSFSFFKLTLNPGRHRWVCEAIQRTLSFVYILQTWNIRLLQCRADREKFSKQRILCRQAYGRDLNTNAKPLKIKRKRNWRQ